MKVIIAGSRTFKSAKAMADALKDSPFTITEVVSGNAQGADKLGEAWADENGINKSIFPANWNKHGRAAGPIRNKEMADYADAAIVFWDGKSRGTKNMIENMEALKKPVHIIKF